MRELREFTVSWLAESTDQGKILFTQYSLLTLIAVVTSLASLLLCVCFPSLPPLLLVLIIVFLYFVGLTPFTSTLLNSRSTQLQSYPLKLLWQTPHAFFPLTLIRLPVIVFINVLLLHSVSLARSKIVFYCSIFPFAGGFVLFACLFINYVQPPTYA